MNNKRYTVKHRQLTANLKHLECGCPAYKKSADDSKKEYDGSFDLREQADKAIHFTAYTTFDHYSVTLHYTDVIIFDDEGNERVINSTLDNRAWNIFRRGELDVALCLLQEAQDNANK